MNDQFPQEELSDIFDEMSDSFFSKFIEKENKRKIQKKKQIENADLQHFQRNAKGFS